MSLFFEALESVSVLFILIIIGFLAGRGGLVSENGSKELTKLVIYVTLPATILTAMMRALNMEALKELLIITLVTALSYFVIVPIAYLLTRKFKLPAHQRDVLFIGACMSNVTFMGFPVLVALYGEGVLFFAALSQVFVFEFFSWFFALHILQRNVSSEATKISIISVLKRPTIIAAIIGMILFLTQLPVPNFMLKTIRMTGAATSPLAMIIVGLMLSKSDVKKSLSNKYLYYTSAIKLIIIPSVILCIMYVIGMRDLVLGLPTVELAMPTAAYLAMLSSIAGNDTELASQQVFVSSLLSVATIPVMATIIISLMPAA